MITSTDPTGWIEEGWVAEKFAELNYDLWATDDTENIVTYEGRVIRENVWEDVSGEMPLWMFNEWMDDLAGERHAKSV